MSYYKFESRYYIQHGYVLTAYDLEDMQKNI